MPLYVRKAISVGPFRFNLSKSGVGLSVGVKGLRLGAGPRGNYVHMGRGGLYYRATLPPIQQQGARQPAPVEVRPEPAIPANTHGPMVEIESADAATIVDSSSRALLQELQEKRRTAALWPIVAASFAGVVLLAFFAWKWQVWAVAVVAGAGLAATALAHSRDILRKTAVVFYELDQELEQAYQRLQESARELGRCSALWHVAAHGQVHDRKYHAGASSLVSRVRTSVMMAEPPYLKTNVETVAIGVGKQTLHFFPDRVLIYDPRGVGAVGYQQLQVRTGSTRFIEDGSVPNDAQVVDRTWRYVNKAGGPDRRFKDNRELPICLYDEITLSSETGLNELVQLSKTGAASGFAAALQGLAKLMPQEREA